MNMLDGKCYKTILDIEIPTLLSVIVRPLSRIHAEYTQTRENWYGVGCCLPGMIPNALVFY